MAGLGVVMTAIYVAGLVLRAACKHGPLGPDSWVAVVVYALGIVGLLVIA